MGTYLRVIVELKQRVGWSCFARFDFGKDYEAMGALHSRVPAERQVLSPNHPDKWPDDLSTEAAEAWKRGSGHMYEWLSSGEVPLSNDTTTVFRLFAVYCHELAVAGVEHRVLFFRL